MSLQDMAGGESYDDPPAITLGQLRDGETVTLDIREGVETFTSQHAEPGEENDALRWPATFVSSDFDFEPDDDDPIETGDDVVLISWSSGLAQAIIEAADEPDASDLVGETVEIQKFQSSADRFDVTYRVLVGSEVDDE